MSTKKPKAKSTPTTNSGTTSKARSNGSKRKPSKALLNGNGTYEKVGVLSDAQLHQLTGFVDSKDLLKVLTSVKNGDFSVRMPLHHVGLSGKICDSLNDIISMNEKMMKEFTKAG